VRGGEREARGEDVLQKVVSEIQSMKTSISYRNVSKLANSS